MESDLKLLTLTLPRCLDYYRLLSTHEPLYYCSDLSFYCIWGHLRSKTCYPGADYDNFYHHHDYTGRNSAGIYHYYTTTPQTTTTTTTVTTTAAPSITTTPSATTTTPPVTTTVPVISPNVGTFVSADGNALVTIPDGCAGQTTSGQSVMAITVTPVNNPPAPPANANSLGLYYEFGPTGATFNSPVSISLKYDPSALPAGTDQSKLYVAFWDAGNNRWVDVPSVVDQGNHTITVSVPLHHFFCDGACHPFKREQCLGDCGYCRGQPHHYRFWNLDGYLPEAQNRLILFRATYLI